MQNKTCGEGRCKTKLKNMTTNQVTDTVNHTRTKKKKKKKSFQSDDRELITVKPRTPVTDEQQSCQDRPAKKKKKKNKSERIQIENEEVRTNSVQFSGSSERSEGLSEITKKKKKKKKSFQSDDQEMITVEPKISVKVEQQNRQDRPESMKKKKNKSERVQTENEEVRIVSGLQFLGSSKQSEGLSEITKKKKKKKRTGDGGLCDVESSQELKINGKVGPGDTVLTEMHLNNNVESAPTTLKKSKKRKRTKSWQSDDQEFVTIESKTTAADELVLPEKEKTVAFPSSEQNQLASHKRKKKKKKKQSENDQVEDEEASRGNSGLILQGRREKLEQMTDLPKKRKKKAEEDGRLNVKGGGVAQGKVPEVCTYLKERVPDESTSAAHKKSAKRKRRRSIQDLVTGEPQSPATDENAVVENAEWVTDPSAEQNHQMSPKRKRRRQRKKAGIVSEQVEEELRQVNDSILPGSGEHSEELTDIPKKKKRKKKKKTEDGRFSDADKSVELEESGKAGRGESIATEMQLNEAVSNDENLEISSTTLKKRKTKKKRKQSVESSDQESVLVDPCTTGQPFLVEDLERIMEDLEEITDITKKEKKKKKGGRFSDAENKLELKENGSILSGSDEDLDEITDISKKKLKKKKKKRKKKNTEPGLHATRDNSDELHSQSDDNSGSEATDGASSSSEILTDFDEEDFRKPPASSVPWLVKHQRGYFMYDAVANRPRLHRKTHFYEEERKQLRAKGYTVKEGRWSGLEENHLRKNLEKFCKYYGIDDYVVLLIPTRFGLKKQVASFWRTTNMLVKLAHGIPRTLNTVYLRAVKLFDPWHCQRRFTKAELTECLRLRDKYGHRWQYIGDRLKRSSESVRHLLECYKSGERKGKWLKFELQQLYDAVMEVTAPLEGEPDRFINIPWKKVAEMVPSRSVRVCAQKWHYSVSWRLDERKKHVWSAKDYVDLLELVEAANVREEFEIDWLSIYDKLSDRVCSKTQLASNWHKLKTKFVPNYYFMEYNDILDTLIDKGMPSLKETAAKEEKDEAKRAERRQKPNSQVYFISDSEEEDSTDDWM